MEKLKIKHDHKLTDILKVGIFCLFLILPILLFLPNCLYYGFNEHATNTETTTINYKYQSNEVNTFDDLVDGNVYYLFLDTDFLEFDLRGYNINNTSFNFTIVNGYIEFETLNDTADYYGNPSDFNGINVTFDTSVLITRYGYTSTQVPMYSGYIEEMDFIYHDDCYLLLHDNNLLPQYSYYNVIESVEVNTDNTITTQIGNSWASLWQTPFLQWTDNNNFQFTINAFTNVFGITQESYITNYLNYILTMTCIYLVFDIVISISTKLTHMLTNSKD